MMSSKTVAIIASTVAVVATTVALKLWREIARQKQLRASERQGRIRVEKKILDSEKTTKSGEESVWSFHPIGYVQSVFEKRLGTPRQPGIVTAAHSTIVLNSALKQSIDSLNEFSHLWVLFAFHNNTNIQKRLLAKKPFDGLKLLVEPPKAQSRKVGVLSCRTPHRPNPIGLSLCRIVRVDQGGTIEVAGLDCLDGTPVIDIKPYLPIIECVGDAKVPDWIYQGVDKDREMTVEWACNVPPEIDTKSVAIVEETLARDIRSRNQIRLGNEMAGDWMGELRLKNVIVKYSVEDATQQRIVKIVSIIPS
jgi:tRNA-Thr(GGU) m(6)t(6)A37 methyltransferase TsaA